MLDIFIRKNRFTWFILIFLVVVGLFVMVNIPKESTPEIKIPIIGVTTAYPGASSLDVEELVTDPLEKQLIRGLQDVKEISSNSSEGISSITIEFESSVDIDKALREVNDEINKIKNDLPGDALDPTAQEFSFDDQPVFVVSLSSKEAFTQLSDTAESVEDIFLDINGISRVDIAGIPERQMTIIVDKKDLSALGINISDIARTIEQTDISFPMGSIVQDGVEYNISVDNTVGSREDLENIIVISNQAGSPVYMKDIARIEDGLAPYTSWSRLSTHGSFPQQAITFSIYKQVGFDITQVTKDARNAVSHLRGDFPDMEFITLIDRGKDVSSDISSLTTSALLTILLVVVVLSLGLGIRESIIAGISVPLSFLLSFIGLYFSGNTINFVSLFALILSIGLLVDASVVIIEGISLARTKGLSPHEAIRATLKEFATPVIAGTLTTLVVFIPLATLSGVVGQVIRSIPVTIIFVLLASLFVALVFVPLLSTINLPKMKEGRISRWLEEFDKKRDFTIEKLNAWYRRRLELLLGNKKYGTYLITGLIALFILAIVLVATGLVKSEFFPADQFDQVTITAELPQGSQLIDMSESMVPVEKFLQEYEYVDSFVSRIRPASADITVILKDASFGDQSLADFRSFFAKNTSNANFIVTPPSSGASVGAPFSVDITGVDYDVVTKIAEDVKNLVEHVEGTTDVQSSSASTALGIVLNLDVKKVKDVGLDVATVSGIVRGSLYGSEVATISHNGEDVDVVLLSALNEAYTQSDTTNHISLDVLRSFPLQTPYGEVLLGSLMQEEIRGTNPSIKHVDGDRVVTISSYLEDGIILNDVIDEFSSQIERVENIDQVEWSLGGDAEASAESGAELMIALLVGILLVFGVLIFQFNSIRNTFFIISVVPLGLIGVLFGLFLFGQTLSFPAMLGFVALVGIVVNNSIILIDVITGLQKNGTRSHRDTIIQGSASRLRPILLTTTTTVTGMVPLLFTSPVWRPLALAIISGLLFAVVLTLFLIPLLFYRWGRK